MGCFLNLKGKGREVKVTGVEEFLIDEISTDETDCPLYRRISADTWENQIGGSWDPVSWHGESKTAELEAAYQEFLQEERECVVAAVVPEVQMETTSP